jgi:hypothetical protein
MTDKTELHVLACKLAAAGSIYGATVIGISHMLCRADVPAHLRSVEIDSLRAALARINETFEDYANAVTAADQEGGK